VPPQGISRCQRDGLLTLGRGEDELGHRGVRLPSGGRGDKRSPFWYCGSGS
jgi:hypothetical protein